MCEMCRRQFLGGVLALGTVAAGPTSARAQRDEMQSAAGPMAQRDAAAMREFVITNAYVITMDPGLGDIPAGAVHVRNGEIAAVARTIDLPGVPVIDGTDKILLPGLIDTHWHMWATLFRSFSGDTRESGFFPTLARFGRAMTPSDIHRSTRLAASEAIAAGITTVHDWCHNIASRAHAEADVAALKEVGIRAQWSFGQAIDLPLTETIRLDDLEAMHRSWPQYANSGLINLGMAWRGLFRQGAVPPHIYTRELETARRLGLPITVHVGTIGAQRPTELSQYAQAGVLAGDINIVHATSVLDEDLELVRRSGATVSILPMSEMLGGWGTPSTRQFLRAGVPLGFGVDSAPLVGAANMFGVLKFAIAAANVDARSEFELSPRRALEIGTIGGATVLGIADRVGSLKPGKRADLMLVSTDALNMGVFTDPVRLLIECATPDNIETVVVDGHILKHGGRMVRLNVKDVVHGARSALAGVRARANWR